MPVSSSDVQRRLTTKDGTAGNSQPGTPNGSLGKYVATTLLTDNTLHNLFDLVTGAENQAQESEYRCLAFLNNHATSSMTNLKAWIVSQGSGGVNFEIGADTNGAAPKDQTSAQFLEVANEDTAPAGVAFSAPTTEGAAITLGGGTVPAGSVVGLWIRRIATDSPAKSGDDVLIRIKWDSV